MDAALPSLAVVVQLPLLGVAHGDGEGRRRAAVVGAGCGGYGDGTGCRNRAGSFGRGEAALTDETGQNMVTASAQPMAQANRAEGGLRAVLQRRLVA
jgi:hypothetical protein